MADLAVIQLLLQTSNLREEAVDLVLLLVLQFLVYFTETWGPVVVGFSGGDKSRRGCDAAGAGRPVTAALAV